MTIRERRIFKKAQKKIAKYYAATNFADRTLVAMGLNTIRADACNDMLNDRISYDFYVEYFCSKEITMTYAWWEANRKKFEKN
jgi:hypothetical protein